MPLTKHDRLAGGLLGLLLGDACGVPVEFSTRGERMRDPVQGMRGWGTHHQPYGSWSDDGALALAHVHALLMHGWDPPRHLDEFQAWFERGAHSATGAVFDIGATTAQAIRRWSAGRVWSACGCSGERSNGNGSLMRVLPVACWMAAAAATERIHMLTEASALTHAHIRSQLACAWYGELVVAMLVGSELPVVLREVGRHLLPLTPEPERRWFEPLADGSLLDRPLAAIASDGHVISTLHAAVWCLHRGNDFADTVLLAVNLGGDTDTTAAVVGGLAGLRHGVSGLPRTWLTCLRRRVELLSLADRFATACLERSAGRAGLEVLRC